MMDKREKREKRSLYISFHIERCDVGKFCINEFHHRVVTVLLNFF